MSKYFDWICKLSSNTLEISTDNEFLDIFKLDKDLDRKLKETLHNILCLIAP